MRYLFLLFLGLLGLNLDAQEEDFGNFIGEFDPFDRIFICPTYSQPVGLPFLGMGNNCFMRSFSRINVVAPEQDAIINSTQNPALLHQPNPYNAIKTDYTPWQANFNLSGVYAFKASLQKQFRKGSSWDVRYENFAVAPSLDFGENSISRFSPQLQTLRLAYANTLSDHWSIGLAAKYANQRPKNEGFSFSSVKTVNVVAADIGFKYQNSRALSETQELFWQWGFSLSNLGAKVESQPDDNAKYPLPTTLSVGFLIEQQMQLQGSASLRIRAAYQINKLLTPLSCISCDDNGNLIPDYLDHSAFGGMLVSFSDSPDGLSGEFKEINHQFDMGGAYSFNNKFSLRSQLTLFYQHPDQGNTQYLASQLGMQWGKMQLDLVYYTPFNRPENGKLGLSLGYLHFLDPS